MQLRFTSTLVMVVVALGCGGKVEPGPSDAIKERVAPGGDLGAAPGSASTRGGGGGGGAGAGGGGGGGQGGAGADAAGAVNGTIESMTADRTGAYAGDELGKIWRYDGAGTVSRVADSHTALPDANFARGIAVDATWVYWSVMTVRDGAILRAPKDGAGAAEIVVSGQKRPNGVAVAPDGTLVWADEGSDEVGGRADDGAIMALDPTSGAPPRVVAGGLQAPEAVTFGGDGYAYFMSGPWGGVNGSVQRVSLAGGAPETLASGLDNVYGGLVVRDGVVYFRENDALRSVSIGGGAVATIAGAGLVGVVASDARGIVYATYDFPAKRATLLALDAGAATTRTIARTTYPADANVAFAWGLATFGDTVYFSDSWWSYASPSGHVTIDRTGD